MLLNFSPPYALPQHTPPYALPQYTPPYALPQHYPNLCLCLPQKLASPLPTLPPNFTSIRPTRLLDARPDRPATLGLEDIPLESLTTS